MAFDSDRDPEDWSYVRLVSSFVFNFKPIDEGNPGIGQTLVLSVSFYVSLHSLSAKNTESQDTRPL